MPILGRRLSRCRTLEASINRMSARHWKTWQFITAQPVLYRWPNVDVQRPPTMRMVDKSPGPCLRLKNAEVVVPVRGQLKRNGRVCRPRIRGRISWLELGQTEPGLKSPDSRRLSSCWTCLTFFTAGPKEVPRLDGPPRVRPPPQAAGRIHTDFLKRALSGPEGNRLRRLHRLRGETGEGAAGKLRLEGLNTSSTKGDVMHFRFNV